jgi:GT2 family glycosyltransferase
VPDVSATRAERFAVGNAMAKHIRRPAYVLRKDRMGLLSGNSSLVSKKVWEELGGYDERYAAGGEDAALGRQMLRHGYRITFEPALTVYHSHGLGWIGLWRQLREWRRLARPLPFDETRLKKFRRDLSLS